MSSQRPVIALQLYTLRDLAARDMAGVLKEVAAIGYEGVELAGSGNLTVEEVGDLLRQLNLQAVSSHIGFPELRDNFDRVVSQAKAVGYRYVVCPSVPADRRGSAQGYASFAQTLSELGRRLREEAGARLCYHNHAFELEDRFDGKMGLDVLYENSDAANLQAEIDTYWVQKGGADPAAYIAKLKGRAPLIHIKDMANDQEQSFAEIGVGILDWPAIFSASEAGGAVAYIVEQDTCPGNPLDSVRISFENLKKMGKL